MERRHFIGTALSTLAAASIGRVTPALGNDGSSDVITAAGNPLRMPPVWNGSSMLMPALVNQQVWPGVTTRVISTAGYPGATIVKRTGDRLRVQFHNMLTSPTAIHWHGLDLPAAMDGHPKDQFAANASKTYQFDVTNRAGLYFYHSHAHMMTAEQVYRGLYGLFIVRDAEEDALQLPSGAFEVPMAIQDVRIDGQSQFVYAPDMLDRMEGHLGNKVLVNGTPDAYLNVRRGWYRLRLVNASNARIYHVGFSDERPFHIIGSDGGLLASPATATTLPLAPGERYDVLVDLSDMTVGSNVRLVSRPYTAPVGHMGSPVYPQGMPFDLVRLDVVEGEGASFTLPATLSAIERYAAPQAVRTRVFDLEMEMMMGMRHSINGKLFQMERVDERVQLGDLEVWEIVNKDADMMHPIHIHGGVFQLLDRNGSAAIPAWEQGWKDTFIVHPNERIRVAVRFANHTGLFLLHCHNLEHEDDGMMLNFEVTPATDVRDGALIDTQAWYAPRQDAIIVRCGSTAQRRIHVVDDSGRIILTDDRVLSELSEHAIPAGTLSSGTYTVLVGSVAQRIAVIR